LNLRGRHQHYGARLGVMTMMRITPRVQSMNPPARATF
jgi:hypothetical protein